jgi:hypothetical protein
MKKLANGIQKRLNQIDFNQCWPGFHQFPFILYNEKLALIDGVETPKPDQFYGNTSLTYEGKTYAIWKIDENDNTIDLDILTSKIVHEMFHGFQQEQNETRFPNELKALDYSYDCVNLSMKYLEASKIQKLLKNYSDSQLNDLLISLNYRQTQYSVEFSYESKIETVEGMAQFVELQALKQLNIDLYHKKIFKMIDYIKTIDNYSHIRFLSYDFGTLLLLIIKENGLPFDDSISNPKTVSEQLLDIPFDGVSKPYCKLEIRELIRDIYQTRSKTIDNILKNPHDSKELQHQLYGFDPLNTFKHNHYIYCKDFAGIKGKEMTWLRGEMLFELDDNENIKKLYTKKSTN